MTQKTYKLSEMTYDDYKLLDRRLVVFNKDISVLLILRNADSDNTFYRPMGNDFVQSQDDDTIIIDESINIPFNKIDCIYRIDVHAIINRNTLGFPEHIFFVMLEPFDETKARIKFDFGKIPDSEKPQ